MMPRRMFLYISSLLGLSALCGPLVADERPSIRKSEIVKKAQLAADEIIEVSKQAATEQGLPFPVEAEIDIRTGIVNRYVQDIKAAGYIVYDP